MTDKMVLVTGASGFIGHRLCQLLQAKGYQVRAMLHHMTHGPWHDAVVADLVSDLPANLMRDVGVVFHLAGKAHALTETRQDESEYFQINTYGTQRLLEASKGAGVKTFVYFSSVKAVASVDGVMDESVLAEADTAYGRSKLAAEKLVLEGGFVSHPVVIRPSMVYGNSEKGNLPRMIWAIQARRFPPLPEMHNRRSMVHVDDVVQAAILAAEHAEAAGKTYIVTDGEGYSTRQMYAWICEALHKPVPVWHLPFFVLKAMGKVGDLIGLIHGKRFVFDSDALEKLTGDASYSSQKISDELGYRAKHNLKDSLPGIVAFLAEVKS